MGKREELKGRLAGYCSRQIVREEFDGVAARYFMEGVNATIAEFVFDDEKTPLDVDIESVKTKWFSQHEVPTEGNGGTYMIVKYTDEKYPAEGLLRHFNGRWMDYYRATAVRPFVWTRIPE